MTGLFGFLASWEISNILLFLSHDFISHPHFLAPTARPCSRCVKRGIADSCQDGVRKKAKYLLTEEELGKLRSRSLLVFRSHRLLKLLRSFFLFPNLISCLGLILLPFHSRAQREEGGREARERSEWIFKHRQTFTPKESS